MKRTVKLIFFFSNSYILLFLFSTGLYFLDLLIASIRTMPVEPDYSGNFASALLWAVPVSLYGSILLCHTYAARKKVSVFISMFIIIALSGVFTFGAFLGIQQLQGLNFSIGPGPVIEKQPGLILSRGEAAMVLLSGNGTQGPRVVSFPEQELLYQGEDWGPVNMAAAPALPFGDDTPWFIHSIFVDFALSARQLDTRFHEGFFSLLIYGGGLIILLGSFRSLLGLSAWPLANLFLGALIFRGILSFEGFLNSQEIQLLISAFLGERLPLDLITPLIFICLGSLLILYTFLSYLAWGRRTKV